MTPNRTLLLAVLYLGFLSHSGREAQAQTPSLADAASLAYRDLSDGYGFAYAVMQDLYASEGYAAYYTNAAMAWEYANQAQLYAGYDYTGQDYSSALNAAYYADFALNYAYLAYLDNPSDNTYIVWYYLYTGAIAAHTVVSDMLMIGY
jgi:hypothetical protein